MKPIKLKGLLKEEKQPIVEAKLTAKQMRSDLSSYLNKNADKIAKEFIPKGTSYKVKKNYDGIAFEIDSTPDQKNNSGNKNFIRILISLDQESGFYMSENKTPIQKEALDDLDVNLPTAVNRFLEKLTAQLKTYNLPRKKEVLVIAKIIDGLNMDKQEVMRAIQRIKQADAFGGQKKNDAGVVSEKAPEGWEGTVKAMKDEPGIDNPYALTNWMKNKGYQSHKK